MATIYQDLSYEIRSAACRHDGDKYNLDHDHQSSASSRKSLVEDRDPGVFPTSEPMSSVCFNRQTQQTRTGVKKYGTFNSYTFYDPNHRSHTFSLRPPKETPTESDPGRHPRTTTFEIHCCNYHSTQGCSPCSPLLYLHKYVFHSSEKNSISH